MRRGGASKLAQQPTHHMGRARTRKNCEERIEGRSSDRILGWSEIGSRAAENVEKFKGGRTDFFCVFLLCGRPCIIGDDGIPRMREQIK